MNLFLIESPLQLKSFFNIRKSSNSIIDDNFYLIVRLNENTLNTEIIKNLIFQAGISDKVSYFHSSRGNRIELAFFVAKLATFHYGLLKSSNKLFIGDQRSKWMRIVGSIVKASNVYFMDDGMATVVLYEQLLCNNEKLKANEIIITSFNLPMQNSIPIIRVELEKKNKTLDSSYSIILGMPMLEFSVISESCYHSYIRRVIEHLSINKDVSIIYIPHRNEIESNVNKIRDNFDIDILRLSSPVEDWLDTLDTIPYRIYSLYSTSIVNIEMMFDGVGVFSYDISGSDVNKKYYDSIEMAYSYIRNYSSIKFI